MRIQGSLTQCILLLALCTVFSTPSHDGDAAERKTLSAASNSKDLYIPGGKSSWCRDCMRCDTSSKKTTGACKRACAKCPKNLILEAHQDITLAAPDDINLEAQEDINLQAKKNLILSALEDLTLEAQKDLILEAQESIGVRLKDKTIIEAVGFENFDGQELIDLEINSDYVDVSGQLYADGGLYAEKEFYSGGKSYFYDNVEVFDDLSLSRGTLILNGPLTNYKVDPIVLGGQTCTCNDNNACNGTALSGGIALGSKPKKYIFEESAYFPIVCQCEEVAACGWYSFTAICPDNVVSNEFETEVEETFPGEGAYVIRGPIDTTGDPFGRWVYIYFQAPETLSQTLSWSFNRQYDGDTSFPFYNITTSDPGTWDFAENFDFAASDGSLPYDPTEYFAGGTLDLEVPAGAYYLFGVYKKEGDSNPSNEFFGANLFVGPGLPSCAEEGGVSPQAKPTNKIKAKRAKRTSPPTKKPHKKPNHA